MDGYTRFLVEQGFTRIRAVEKSQFHIGIKDYLVHEIIALLEREGFSLSGEL